LGYAAKGTVYIILGGLAFRAAIGSGGSATDQEGAFAAILRQPFGQILLIIVAIGLFGYALWRFVQAAVDPENEGTDFKGIAKRIGYVVSGIIYGGFAISAVQLARGSGGSNDGNSPEEWTARLMSQPMGQWLVGLVGVIVIGTGLYQFYRAYSAKFREELKLHEMSAEEEQWATRMGRLGHAARGVVYLILGSFLVQAAIQADPQEAGGLGEALQTLAQQPYGPWLLGIVALGLMAYGAFAIVLARYRRIYIQ
jgi:hypothetical protein